MTADLLHRNTNAKRALLGAVLSATCLSTSAASFDCAKARSKSERLICGDAKLSALDNRLAALAAAGKKRAASPRAYQRALDAAWSVRQKCDDIACVESWYAGRIEALGNADPGPDTLAEKPPAKEQLVAPAIPARPAVVAEATAPAPQPRESASPAAPAAVASAPKVEALQSAAPAPTVKATGAAAPATKAAPPVPAPRRAAVPPVIEGPAKPNVSPGAQLLVIGDELGFNIPLTRKDFLDRYDASGGQCGVSQHLSSLKALSRSVESDCWTGSECPAPAAGLSCKILRTAYDNTGRIVLFMTTLSTVDANRAEGVRHMGKVVDKFAEFGGSETRTRDVKNGRLLSSTGSLGQFKLEAEVTTAEGGKQVGTFSVSTK